MEIVLFSSVKRCVDYLEKPIEFVPIRNSPLQLSGEEDEHFRRFLAVEKDVKLIDDVLELVCRDFDNIQQVAHADLQCCSSTLLTFLERTSPRELRELSSRSTSSW